MLEVKGHMLYRDGWVHGWEVQGNWCKVQRG